MKVKIVMSLIYPNDPPSEGRPYGTRNENDAYTQVMEIKDDEESQAVLIAVIKAFNALDK